MSAAAIIAVIHDIIFTVGVYALFHFAVTPATITAFLTILGFSLYDTVVVFDKVRENQRVLTATGRTTYSEMVNQVAQPGAHALAVDVVRRAHAGAVAAVRRRRDIRGDVARGVRARTGGRVCSSVRTRRSSSRRRSSPGGRNASRSTARWPSARRGPSAIGARRCGGGSGAGGFDAGSARRPPRPTSTVTRASKASTAAPEVEAGVPGPPAVGRTIQPARPPATPPQTEVTPLRRDHGVVNPVVRWTCG